MKKFFLIIFILFQFKSFSQTTFEILDVALKANISKKRIEAPAVKINDFDFKLFQPKIVNRPITNNLFYNHQNQETLRIGGILNSRKDSFELVFLEKIGFYQIYGVYFQSDIKEIFKHGFIIHDYKNKETYYIAYLSFFDKTIQKDINADFFSVYKLDGSLVPISCITFYKGNFTQLSLINIEKGHYYKTIYYHGKDDKRKIDIKLSFPFIELTKFTDELVFNNINEQHIGIEIYYDIVNFGISPI